MHFDLLMFTGSNAATTKAIAERSVFKHYKADGRGSDPAMGVV